MSGRGSGMKAKILDVPDLAWQKTCKLSYNYKDFFQIVCKNKYKFVRYHLLRQWMHHIGRQKQGVQPSVGRHLRTKRTFALLIAQPKH